MRAAARSTFRRILGAGTGTAVLAAGLVALAAPPAAQAHGSSQNPPSRIYNCNFLHPDDPMCARAWQQNPQALYDWMEINISNADGRHRELIPDGKLCSAGRDKYAAFDTPSTEWRTTRLNADNDGKYTFTWESSAPHATKYYRVYLTKQGFDPSQPLKWDDLELVHDTGALPAERQTTIRTALPARTGPQMLYTIWQRSDSTEAFYSCADVRLDADLAPSPTATPTATATAAPTATATPTATASPTASPSTGTNASVEYTVTSDWGSGYCIDGRVTTNSTTPVTWSVPFDKPGAVSSIWNGRLNGTGTARTVAGEFWNPTVSASEPTTFGLCANRTAAATPTPTPTTATPTPTPTTATPTPTPTPTASTPAVTATTTVTSNWGSGYCADVRVATTATSPVTWSVPFTPGGSVQSLWSARVAAGRASGETWNATVSKAAPVTFGFCASGSPTTVTPTPTATPTPTPTTASPTPTSASPTPTTASPTPTSASPTPTATPTPTPTSASPTPTATPTPTPTGPSTGTRRVGYFTAWGIYQRAYLVKNLVTSGSADKLTHVNYAFGNINANGECYIVNQSGEGDAWADYGRSFTAAESVDGVGDTWSQPLRGNFNQLKELKAQNPGLRTLISLGGWTWSKRFSDVALTQASREKFVSSCIDLYIKGNLPLFDGAGGPGSGAGVFDGIDIDWEYPGSPGLDGNVVRPEDTRNYTLLLEEFRRQLDKVTASTGKYYELSAAVAADPAKIAKYEAGPISQALDFINVMTYDFRGSWDAAGPTNFHSNLFTDPASPGSAAMKSFSVKTAIDAWRDGGAPARKLVVGVPFYGRGWTNVTGGGTGLYQPASGAAPATYEAGFEDYKVLRNLPGYTKYRDPVTKQMWIFDGRTFWSYDDAQVLGEKAAYIKNQNLGGAMIWSMDGDTADGELMRALDTSLR